ncbi:MAG TPA: mechanosensitive ion channel family protein [Polyangiaceae bacterium]|nr:mechanosensitive ion channel family protein [Polyangiaceae bacterium]
MEVLDLLHTWGFALLGAVLLLVAFAVNRVAPHKRYRIRHGLILYVLFLVTAGAAALLHRAGWPEVAVWSEHVRLFADLFAAFTFVNIVSLAVFDVALPAIGVNTVAITGDLIVGLAYIFAGFGVLRMAGISTSSVFTTSAVVSGVLAISLNATIGNILGGFALQLDGSVHVGDWLQLADGTQGKIVAIHWRHTVVETRNWDTLIVPNSNLLAQNILILGKRTDKPIQHRMWVYFNVDFRHSPTHVIDVVRDALGASPIEGVASDPKPSVIAYDFAKDGRDSFGYYAARYWLTDLANDDPTSSRVRARIFTALKRAGIPLARPAQTLFVQANEAETERSKRHEQQRLGALDQVELFHALTPEERAFVSSHLTYAPFAAGETCTRQGAVAHWLYVLSSGKVEIRRHVEGGTLTKAVAVLEGPTFFGEMGLMTGETRTADVVALTDVDCYRLDKTGLQRVLEQRPEAAEQFSKTLARRRVELLAAAGGLDDEARKAKMASEENRILDRIQEFFGLERTTKR